MENLSPGPNLNNKIGIDARFILRPMRGMPMYTYMLCQLLPKALPNVHFYIYINTAFKHNDAKENYQPRLTQIQQNPNVSIIDIPSHGEIIWEQWKLPKAIKQNKLDLLHMPGNRVCFFPGTKQIASIHDAMEWKRLSIFKDFSLNRAIKEKFYTVRVRAYQWLQYQFGLRKSDHILTISKYAQTSILHYFPFVANKISYTYHGIPPLYAEQFDASERLVERKGVLMLGGDSFQKNPENMIKAWHSLPEAIKNKHPLTIAGFTGNTNSPISRTITQLKINTNIIIKGWINDLDLVELFKTNRVFLFASREEGFGFPLVQSMKIGTPAVTSTAEVLTELGAGSTLSADAEDPQALAQQLLELLTDDQLWQSCRALGIKNANLFDWDKTALNISQLYIRIIKGH